MAPRRRCPTCGSRQWHKEPSSGLIACSEGHVLQNYRHETTEISAPGQHLMHKRRLKSTREKQGVGSQANPKLYHGARGRYHYFICLQYILRLQIQTITKLWNLPLEFEIVCRDLWSMHLSLLPEAPPPEPLLHQVFQHEGQEEVKKAVPFKSQALTPITEESLEISLNDGDNGDNPHGNIKEYDSDVGESEISESDDSQMEELMRQNSEISSTSDEESPQGTAQASNHTRTTGRSRDGTIRILESPASTLAVLMVAFWTLRIPVLYRDLVRIVQDYGLPYLDPIRLLPSSMAVHLTKHNIQALSPHHAPNTLSLHRLVVRLAKCIYRRYGVFTPECNAAPLLWRLTRSVGGTPTLYCLAKRLVHILAIPLTLHPSLLPKLQRTKIKDPERHKYENVPPEVALMATVIITLKMVYGLDGRPRYPRDVGDPALALPRIDQWLSFLKELNTRDAMNKDGLFNSESTLFMEDLDGHLLDDYLGFCERALLKSQDTNDVAARDFFPAWNIEVDGGSSKKNGPEMNIAQTQLLGGDTLDELDGASSRPPQPAEDYTIWNSRDVYGTLPEDYQVLIGRAARCVQVEESVLSRVVEHYEIRLMRWWEGEKRAGKESEEENIALSA